jgi:hypothetical protein
MENRGTDVYFEMKTPGIRFDGCGHTVTVKNITEYNGLIDIDYVNDDDNDDVNYVDYITVENVHVHSECSSLDDGYGWIGRRYFYGTHDSNGYPDAVIIKNCSSDGIIGPGCGGIVGENSMCTVIDCHSSGCQLDLKNIDPDDYDYDYNSWRNGGIYGANCVGNCFNCHSSGTILGGGIFGGDPYYCFVQNCYSTGAILGDSRNGFGAGGIVGSNQMNPLEQGNTGNTGYDGDYNNYQNVVQNCYSTGDIYYVVYEGDSDCLHGSGGIVGENFSGYVTNCYSEGNIGVNCCAVNGLMANVVPNLAPNNDNHYGCGGICAGNQIGGDTGNTGGAYSEPIVVNCYTLGAISVNDSVSDGIGPNINSYSQFNYAALGTWNICSALENLLDVPTYAGDLTVCGCSGATLDVCPTLVNPIGKVWIDVSELVHMPWKLLSFNKNYYPVPERCNVSNNFIGINNVPNFNGDSLDFFEAFVLFALNNVNVTNLYVTNSQEVVIAGNSTNARGVKSAGVTYQIIAIQQSEAPAVPSVYPNISVKKDCVGTLATQKCTVGGNYTVYVYRVNELNGSYSTTPFLLQVINSKSHSSSSSSCPSSSSCSSGSTSSSSTTCSSTSSRSSSCSTSTSTSRSCASSARSHVLNTIPWLSRHPVKGLSKHAPKVIPNTRTHSKSQTVLVNLDPKSEKKSFYSLEDLNVSNKSCVYTVANNSKSTIARVLLCENKVLKIKPTGMALLSWNNKTNSWMYK